MKRHKSHDYLNIFADFLSKIVILATPGKVASVWEAFAAEMLRYKCYNRAIQRMISKMGVANARGVRNNLGNAPVVYDKSLIMYNMAEACE
jgi:hypothetical protein